MSATTRSILAWCTSSLSIQTQASLTESPLPRRKRCGSRRLWALPERLSIGPPASDDQDDIPYFVNGLGGRSIRSVNTTLADSRAVYTGNYGAVLLTVTSTSASFEFYDITGNQQDIFTLARDCTSTTPE